jgi:hypothetical protein
MEARMRRLPILLALGALTATVAAALASLAALADGAATAPRRAGAPARGTTAFEFVGRLSQPVLGSAQFTAYITGLAGVPDAALFTNPNSESAATARIGIVGTLAVTGHVTQEPLFVTHGRGTFRIYVNPRGGGSLETPSTLSRGRLIATESVRVQDVLNAQSDTRGIETGFLDLRQRAGRAFTLAGKHYRFGRAGLRLRGTTAGEGIRTLQPLRRIVVAAGNAVVTG